MELTPAGSDLMTDSWRREGAHPPDTPIVSANSESAAVFPWDGRPLTTVTASGTGRRVSVRAVPARAPAEQSRSKCQAEKAESAETRVCVSECGTDHRLQCDNQIHRCCSERAQAGKKCRPPGTLSSHDPPWLTQAFAAPLLSSQDGAIELSDALWHEI